DRAGACVEDGRVHVEPVERGAAVDQVVHAGGSPADRDVSWGRGRHGRVVGVGQAWDLVRRDRTGDDDKPALEQFAAAAGGEAPAGGISAAPNIHALLLPGALPSPLPRPTFAGLTTSRSATMTSSANGRSEPRTVPSGAVTPVDP